MKKRYFQVLLASIFVIGILAACGGEEEATDAEAIDESTDNGEENENGSDAEAEDEVEVDKGLSTVEITFPEMFFEGEEGIEEAIQSAVTEDGISEVTQNDDGSVTYKMSKAKHSELMEEVEGSIHAATENIASSEEYPSIQEVNVDSSFSEFTLLVDQEAYENGFDGVATITFGLSGLMYQLFDGVSPDDYSVTIQVADARTEEVFNTIEYPEILDEAENLEEIEEVEEEE